MFNAEDAQKLVSNYYRKGEAVSQEWVVKHLESAVSGIHEAAKHGASEFSYEISMDKETYKPVKKKLLMYALARLGFKVYTSEGHKRDGAMVKYTTFEISWSTPDMGLKRG